MKLSVNYLPVEAMCCRKIVGAMQLLSSHVLSQDSALELRSYVSIAKPHNALDSVRSHVSIANPHKAVGLRRSHV